MLAFFGRPSCSNPSVTEFARRWNEEVQPLLTKQPDELRELITEELTGATGS
jgi:hypothetical protein